MSEQAKAEKEEVRTSASRKKKRITEDTKEERADNSANAKSEREKVSAVKGCRYRCKGSL